jgi:hypothetical protein
MARLTLPGRRRPAKASEPRVPRWAQPLDVPPCPEGWRTGPPDFVGIGAQRAATSWWYRGLEAHPSVQRRKGQRKELHYFNRFWDGQVPEDLAAGYHSLFPRPDGKLVGEWTPRYMHDFWSPALLRQAAPDAKLLALLRDPVERYRSGVARALRLAEEEGAPIRLALLADAVWRGFYCQQLRRVLDLFPAEQVLVLQFERCRDDPLGEMGRTCRFLGIEPLEELPGAMTRERSPQDKPDFPDAMRAQLVATMADDVSRLVELCPEVDLSLWPNFAHLAR